MYINGKHTNKINIEDLLSRSHAEVNIDIESLRQNLKGKTVMITGAAGSIGSELVRQLTSFSAGLLLLCDSAETPLHNLCLEINNDYPEINFTPKLCNIQDEAQMRSVFAEYRPQYIFHAAAYKHVPLMEDHPCEAILTNVLGTQIIAKLAVKYHAEAFVFISTDKAVNPSNVMGASKRIAELYLQSFAHKTNNCEQTKLRVIITRFGNVLGSNGSVIPYFEEQIKKGGPITITHPDMIRYFMTTSEACKLVLEASNLGKSGEIFIFDMGSSINIKDMAEKMIRLTGLEPYEDIDIIYTGLRPGEKLSEELVYSDEITHSTPNPKIMSVDVQVRDHNKIEELTEKLIATAKTYNKTETLNTLKDILSYSVR